jgi:hypothetical protein
MNDLQCHRAIYRFLIWTLFSVMLASCGSDVVEVES